MFKVSFHSIPKIARKYTCTTTPALRSKGADCVTLSPFALFENLVEENLGANSFNFIKNFKFKMFMKRMLPEIIKPENFINEGKNSKVYRINNQYVAKIGKKSNPHNLVHYYNILSHSNDLYKDIDIYYGAPLIKIGNFEILRNAMLSHDNITCGLCFNKKEFTPEEIQEYEKKFLKYCSSLPQTSYDKFACGLRQLNSIALKTGEIHSPDTFNPNNIIISGGEFRIVDELEVTTTTFPNNLYTMLIPLLLKDSAYVEATPNPAFTKFRKIIYSKCLKAAQNAGLDEGDAAVLNKYYGEKLKALLEA